MKRLLLCLGFIFTQSVKSTPIEGCYLESEKINSTVSEESTVETTYIEISKTNNSYILEGIVYGGNFHVCNIPSLKMKRQGKQLLYNEIEPEFNINCTIKVSFDDTSLIINDSSNHCSRYIFLCGTRVNLHKLKLPKHPCSY